MTRQRDADLALLRCAASRVRERADEEEAE